MIVCMKVYMDMCALKRPFDDQSQGRIALETQAVIRILAAARVRSVVLCNSAALAFENELNPNLERRERVRVVLSRLGRRATTSAAVFERAEQLREKGISDMDALHIASAERQKAERFVTCDDRLLKKAEGMHLTVQAIDPVTLVEELDL